MLKYKIPQIVTLTRRNPATDSKQKQAYYTETLEQME